MNAKTSRKEAERLVDNCFVRLRIAVETCKGWDGEEIRAKLADLLDQERGVAVAVVRSIRCGCNEPAPPRTGGTAEVREP